MKIYRIWAIAHRHLLSFLDWNKLIDFFYWPMIDFVLWGFTSKWIQPCDPNASYAGLVVLGALVLWHVTLRANAEITVNILEELWSRNMVNLFASPLRVREWIAALMVLGTIKVIFVGLFGVMVAALCYGVNILELGFFLLPASITLLISGWVIGLLTGAFLLIGGQKIQVLAWMMGWFFAPWCGVFYPLDILPLWVQTFSKTLPMTYVFESLRYYVRSGIIAWPLMITGAVLSVMYCAGALLFFKCMFERSRAAGLARLELE